jgi:hypothetical protein
MAIIGTFGSQNIIQFPFSPAARSVDWSGTSVVSESSNPFSMVTQTFDWGASMLSCSITLPPLNAIDSNVWSAFLLECRGSVNLFQYGDPLNLTPRGTITGTPVTNGTQVPGYTLNLRGFTPSSLGTLRQGDWIQVGQRLYRNLNVINADGSGHATLSIFPQLRELPADGTTVITSNTIGLFKLKSNQVKWTITELRTTGIQLDIREAI